MLGSLKGRIFVIVAVLAVSGWYMFDNYNSCAQERALTGSARVCSPIKLGLDLQGGMHLVLEVDDPEGTMTQEARAEATETALHIIRTRIDQFGVEEPMIQKVGEDRIIVQLPGIEDEERAKDIIHQTAFLQFFLVQSGAEYRAFRDALPRLDRAVLAAFGEDAGQAADQRVDTGREAVEDLLFGTDTVRQDTAAPVQEAAPEEEDPAAAAPSRRPLSQLLLETGRDGQLMVQERDVEMVQRWLADEQVRRAMPRRTSLRWHHEPEASGAQLYRTLWVLQDPAFMRGDELENATPGRDAQYGETIVSFELTRAGGRQFERTTSENLGELIAIVLDEQVMSAPVIRGRIAMRGQITLGQASMEEARDLALVLRAGALPAPLRIMEERTIGPSLGADSIAKGRMAGMIGLIFVILAMIGYYRTAGVLAVGALVVYALILGGGLAAFNATLTLPGIAGLILSIGMAVDANVLIFERIREELNAGRVPRTAADEGFKHAMSAIVDSNLTTLLTALILFQFGTGPVRGFAVTLSVGIVASFFSAVYVTRTLFLLYLARKKPTEAISI
jgi:protein-export membrane protein SecD